MKKKLTGFLLFMLIICCIYMYAAAEEAKEIKTGIEFTANGKSSNFEDMQDDDFRTYFPLKEKKGWLEIHSETPVGGVYVKLFEKNGAPVEYAIQVKAGDDEWETVAEGGQYLVHWHPLKEAVNDIRIAGNSKERIRIAELLLYTEGKKPGDVQDWEEGGEIVPSSILVEKLDEGLVRRPAPDLCWREKAEGAAGGDGADRRRTQTGAASRHLALRSDGLSGIHRAGG